MINALDVLRAYPRGQDSGAWIKMRAEVLDANGYNEDGTRIPKCAWCGSRDIRDLQYLYNIALSANALPL